MQISNLGPKSYARLLKLPLIFFIVAVLLNVLASHGIRDRLLPRRTDEFLKLRMESFLEKAPALLNGTRYAFFWGASEIENGLDTAVLDSVFHDKKMDLKAVNIGMRSIHPLSYRVFAHRVADLLKSRDQKIEVSFVKFPENKLTRAYRAFYPDSTQYGQVGKVMEFSDLELARSRPWAYAGGLFSHFVLRDAHLNLPIDWIETQWKGLYPISEEQVFRNHYFAPWSNAAFLESDLWRLETRGSSYWNLPASAEALEKALELKKNQRVRFDSYTYFEKCCGMSSLTFDQRLVADFVATLKDIRRVSKKVYLYEIPATEEFNLWRRNYYRVRLESILSRIQEEVDVDVIDTSDIHLKDEMYMDFLHLNSDGQKAFYSILLDRLTSAQ